MSIFALGHIPEVGAALGFEVRGNVAEGIVDGQRIWIGIESMHGNWQTTVRGKLDPPLDLGLGIHRREIAMVNNPILTGSNDLDTEFAIDADDHARTAALFTKDVREALVSLHRASYEMKLDDTGIALSQAYGFDEDDAWIGRAAHAAASAVVVLHAARKNLVPAASLTAHAEALRAHVAKRGFTLEQTPLSAHGNIDGRPVSIGSARIGDGIHHLFARAPFEANLGLGLILRRESIFDAIRTMLGGQDIIVGDPAFDRRFLVRADPTREGRIASIVDRDVRAILLDLDHRAGPVSIDDRGIAIEPIVPKSVSPETTTWMIEALDEARTRIEWNLLHAREGGPYR